MQIIYHRTIGKTVELKPSIYSNFYKENNKECANFKVGDHVKISKLVWRGFCD